MRKSKRLILQIGLIVIVSFLIMIGTVTVLMGYGAKNLFLETNNDNISTNLNRYKDLYMNEEITGYVLDYWQQHPEVILEDLDSALYRDFLQDFESVDSLLQTLTLEMIVSTPPEEQKALLKAMYTTIAHNFDKERVSKEYFSICCLDISEENCGSVILFSYDGSEAINDHCFGEQTDYDKEHFRSLFSDEKVEEYNGVVFEEVKYSTASTGKRYYNGYIPCYIDGSPRYVVYVSYDWSDFARHLDHNVKMMLLFGLGIMVIIGGLIMLFMYKKAVSPLVKVNRGVREYMETKDSAAAVKNMSGIKARNEVGILADSIAEMSVEIEQYTQENLRLNGERERVAAELNLAANIQSSQLPNTFPAFPDRDEFDIFASMTPAKEVGGDFYDFFLIDSDHLGLVIADVSGKGVPAAMFMMISKLLIKHYAMSGCSPSEVLEKTNSSIYENNKERMFVTVWFGILEISTGRLTAANAGHEYPAVRQPDGRFELLKDKHGFMIGIRKNKKYTEYEMVLQKGAALFVYTDGVAEATNKDEELYGTDRMLEALNKDPSATPEQLLANVRDSVNGFVREAPQFDDLTMLSVKIK